MTGTSARTGVCLLRLEEQGDRVLITVLVTSDVRAGGEAHRAFVDVEEALAHVRGFVEAFVARRRGDTTA